MLHRTRLCELVYNVDAEYKSVESLRQPARRRAVSQLFLFTAAAQQPALCAPRQTKARARGACLCADCREDAFNGLTIAGLLRRAQFSICINIPGARAFLGLLYCFGVRGVCCLRVTGAITRPTRGAADCCDVIVVVNEELFFE